MEKREGKVGVQIRKEVERKIESRLDQDPIAKFSISRCCLLLRSATHLLSSWVRANLAPDKKANASPVEKI